MPGHSPSRTHCCAGTPQAGALASFLRDLLLAPCGYAAEVEVDLQRCIEVHFSTMPGLVPAAPGSLPPEYLERVAAA